MKKNLFLILIAAVIIPAYGQVPLSVCQITDNPVDDMAIITMGTVTDVPDNDNFLLSSEGCTIECDGKVNEIPSEGDEIILLGSVEVDRDGDLKIEVEYWIERFEPPDPGSLIRTVEEALVAPLGSVASLTGKVIDYAEAPTTEELIYDNETYTGFQALVPERVFAVKMSPSGPCEVLAMKFYVRKQGASEGGFIPALYDWEGTQPATNAVYESLSAVITQTWKQVNIEGSVPFDGDFVVGFKPLDAAAYLAYDDSLDNGRNWVLNITQQEWSAETSHSFLIRAIVRYPATGKSEELKGEAIALYSSASSTGVGTFMDSTGTMAMDFPEGNEPEIDQLVNVLGVVEVSEDGTHMIDAKQWTLEDGSPPPEPDPVPDTVTTAADALAAAEGTVAKLYGDITEYSDEDQGIATFQDGTGTISCDFPNDNTPGMNVKVYILGVVEQGTEGPNVVDVNYWYGQEEEPPPYPDPWADSVATTVDAALDAPEGTEANLLGKVTVYTDLNDGMGTFVDSTGTITVDFADGNKPAVDQEVNIIGVVEIKDGDVKTIDVSSWYGKEEEPPPSTPDTVAWTVDEANSLDIGAYCLLEGEVTSWTNQADGEGNFTDATGIIKIDFEPDVDTLPETDLSFFVLGLTVEDNSVRELHAHYYWMEGSSTGIQDLFIPHERILVYPNPASDIIYVDQNLVFSRAVLYSTAGKKVKSIPYQGNSSIDVSDLLPGVYVLNVYDANERIGSQMIILK